MLEKEAPSDDEYGEYEKLGKIKRKKIYCEGRKNSKHNITVKKPCLCAGSDCRCIYVFSCAERLQ